MKALHEHADLVELVRWIDENTSGIELPCDERSMLAIGCFDVALEHQAAIALLHSSALYGSALALLRSETESLVRGLWLLHCATQEDLDRFKRGKVKQEFQELIAAFEAKVGNGPGVLSGLKERAWKAMNGFTHTGFLQVSRRHRPGLVQENYEEAELAQALDASGALGMIAAGQLIGMSSSPERLPKFLEKMQAYGAKRTAA
ncbi:MAG: hypothetical protein Q8R72_07540 [Hylemonella sp.]|nr:hypothetical protein [Hylemonella sp.]